MKSKPQRGPKTASMKAEVLLYLVPLSLLMLYWVAEKPKLMHDSCYWKAGCKHGHKKEWKGQHKHLFIASPVLVHVLAPQQHECLPTCSTSSRSMHNVQTEQYSAIIATMLFLCHWHAYHHALLSGTSRNSQHWFPSQTVQQKSSTYYCRQVRHK